MKTILNIFTTSGTVLITSGSIDLYDDIPMSLNYNIADIKEPQKRNTDYSKTVTVPGTNNNSTLLAHIYEIGVDRLFNPNHKTEARILYDRAYFLNTNDLDDRARLTLLNELKRAKGWSPEEFLNFARRAHDIAYGTVTYRLADGTYKTDRIFSEEMLDKKR